MSTNVLITDDERAARDLLADAIKDAGYEVFTASNGESALSLVKEEPIGIAICDIRMPGMDGLELLQKILEISPETIVIMVTAYASVETAVNALRKGAFDYILKPLIFEDIVHKISKIDEYLKIKRENRLLRQELEKQYDFQKIIAKSGAMENVFEMMRKVSATTSNILVTGESGTGKEMVARAIHYNSQMKDGKFLPINCGAIPTSLWESEILGYHRGAFTDATRDKAGFLQEADGGTLFLDEITEMPLEAQVKLLRVIENQEFTPLGSVKTHKLNSRIIAASNQDIRRRVEGGTFREDLYYRLNVIHVHIPPLRERREDIPVLVRHFIDRFNGELGKNIIGVDGEVMKLFLSYSWKGNVRELKNFIERAMILSDGDTIRVHDLPAELQESTKMADLMVQGDLKHSVKEFEKISIISVLEQVSYDKKRAASILGLSKSSLYRKMEELGIDLTSDLSQK